MKRYLVLICLGMLVFAAWADDAYRDFTDTQGRTLRGRVLSFDGRKDMVTIELENKRKATVAVAGFSEADQQYIRAWGLLEGVRSESKLKISIERRKVKSWNEKHYGSVTAGGESEGTQMTGKTNYEEEGFDIVFFSRNECVIKGLTLEYCIYYEQEVLQGQVAQTGVLYGFIPIDGVTPNDKKVISTDSVCVFEYATGEQFINAYELKGEIMGLSWRLFLVADGEKTLVREATYPDSLSSSYAWATESKRVGKN